MQTVALSINGMTCGHCVVSVRRALESIPGVAVRDVRVGSAEIALNSPTASEQAIVAAVQDAGYEATVSSTSNTPIPTETARVGSSCCAPSPVARANGDRTSSTAAATSSQSSGASCH